MTFNTHSFGKWILSGEHTVLRGGEALSFPVFSRKMSLWYESGDEDLAVKVTGEHQNVLEGFSRVLLKNGCELLGKSPFDLKGELRIHNEIPIGTGLGGSAALAVNLAKFFAAIGWDKEENVFSLARSLEDVAHGKSSGVDIATILSSRGTHFSMKHSWASFDPEWIPSLYLHFSGKRGLTADSIKKVESLANSDQRLAETIDEDMKNSVSICQDALRKSKKQGMEELIRGINLASSCFSRWNLVTPELEDKTQWLVDNGALAVKPVGSGGGGYLVSLWEHEPPADVAKDLIPCFQ